MREEVFLSIVIPVYNEEKRIGQLPLKLGEFFKDLKRNCEVILVDDGSADRTLEIAESFAKQLPNLRILKYKQNSGKGKAVRTGMLNSTGKLRLMTDIDFSTPLSEFYKLWEVMERTGTDIVIGSRAIDRKQVLRHQLFWREALGRLFNRFIQFLLLPGIHDSQCGFKLFKSEAAQAIFSFAKINRWSFDVESLFLARKLGFKIVEMPVLWENDPRSTVSPLRDLYQTVKDLLSIRFGSYAGIKKA